MKCPACGNEEAYMGFSSIDCPNSLCRHHQQTFPSPPTTQVPTNIQGFPGAGSPGIQGPAGQAASNPTGIATLNLTVDITASVAKRNSVLISLVAHGDPGAPNKNIEILWSMAGMATPRICTLSGRHTYLMAGIDADGQTVYNTHWQCTLDGVQPTDPWTLTARVFP